jgi:hypothetical protein
MGTNNKNYRDDYLLFLNELYKLNLSSIPEPYDVDHLCNADRAKIYALRFLRTALVPYRPNRFLVPTPRRPA